VINSLIMKMTAIPSYVGSSFLGFPTWYEFLPLNADKTPELTSISDVWLIVAAVIDILLRVAAIVAIVIVIYGGIQFITSGGDPQKASSARTTITNAIIGLVIAVTAATLVTFVAGRFNAS
jgi:ABC-type Fe3+ transport system permease subunit